MEKKPSKIEIRDVMAAFVIVARHARNFPHPEIPIERLRAEATTAEQLAENILGTQEYNSICHLAFPEVKQH